jgi:DNA processing protein
MNTISPETLKLLSLWMLKGIGPAALRKLGTRPSFNTASVTDLAKQVPALAKAWSEEAWSEAQEEADAQVKRAGADSARILSPLDAEYPALLKATKDDPYLLYVKGRLAPSPERSVAIIGTREPTAHGRVIAERIAHYFVEQGWSVVSGLALGCDAVAHRSVLQAKGHTVAVLAHGLQTIAPSQHRGLSEEILAGGGALVSEFSYGTEPLPPQFVKRDRTQAGMTQGVVMVQSDIKGGSLHASSAALDYGRWLAVPYPTERDRTACEAKIQANLVLADGSAKAKVGLLKGVSQEDLKRIIVLRSRDDYGRCLEQAPRAPVQRTLV